MTRAQYTSAAFAELQKDWMWSKVRQMACREEQIPEIGDCLLYEALPLGISPSIMAPATFTVPGRPFP